MILTNCKNLNQHSTKLVEVDCDVKLSPNCKQKWSAQYRGILITLKKNQCIICRQCSLFTKNRGRTSPGCQYKYINDYLFQNINSNIAYIIGYIASDGWITKDTIRISSIDFDIIEKIKNIISLELPIKTRIHSNNINYYLSISSTQMVNDICYILKINPGKKNDKLSEINIDKKYFKDFIRGYFDGDGHIPKVSSYLRPTIVSCSLGLLNTIQKFCNELNINSKIYQHSKKSYVLVWTGKNAINFLNLIYSNSTIYMNRKYFRYLEVLSEKNIKVVDHHGD